MRFMPLGHPATLISVYPPERFVKAVVLSTDLLMWHSESKKFSAECSELPNPFYDELYDDAHTVGVILFNPKTNTKIPFFFIGVKRDRDQDITSWEFKVSDCALAKRPDLEGLTLTVFND